MMPRCWRNETPFLTFLKNRDPFKERIVHLRAGEELRAPTLYKEGLGSKLVAWKVCVLLGMT